MTHPGAEMSGVEGPGAHAGQAGDQLPLVRASVRRSRPKPPDPPAAVLPVARVAVDVPLAHLDRLFDYAVSERQSAAAVPGVRVRVRFAGRLVDGFVLDRAATTEHPGRLARLHRVVSAEPVLTPQVARLARAVADRYAGTLADVVRLAVPPRHAAVEAAASTGGKLPPTAPEPGPWAALSAGEAFLAALAAGGSARAVLQVPPGAGTVAADWPDALARAALATASGGRGALLVVPDARDAQRLDAALRTIAGAGSHVLLSADLGPAERYRRWLAVLRGAVRVVVGTRAAAFAPLADLGLVAVWDDGDDLHAEPRAPYPHAREVLLLRAHDTGCAALLAGHARTAEAQHLVASGWAAALEVPRAQVRRLAPRIRPAGEDAERAGDAAARAARLPSLAWRTARDGLARGPVLVQVPRSGYLPWMSCAACREPARCRHCHGPLGLSGNSGHPSCAWCGQAHPDWTCPHCRGSRLRAPGAGSRRTAEELGRAFPGVPVRTSWADGTLETVPGEPALVVATPGAEPVAAGGYAAALLLDGSLLLQRHGLRAAEEAIRRWFAAAALVRAGDAGGTVAVVAPAGTPVVQALLRWDPAGAAERELAERRELAFPPAARLAELSGVAEDLVDLLATLHLPPGADVLGPVPAPLPSPGTAGGGGVADAGDHGDRARALIRVPRRQGAQLSRALQGAQGVRSARRSGGHVRVRVDPVDLA